MKKILIADDHEVVRKGLKYVLSDELPKVIFGEASNSSEVFKRLQEDSYDLILLDINMPGRNGLDILKQLKSENNKTPTLVLSMLAEDQIAIRVLKLGGFGYLSKDAPNSELITAVNCILEGKRYITPSLAELLASNIENPVNKNPHEFLSDREFQTLVLMGRGKNVSQIAEELCISINTISTYRARILEKMKLKTSAELISYAIRHNLV